MVMFLAPPPAQFPVFLSYVFLWHFIYAVLFLVALPPNGLNRPKPGVFPGSPPPGTGGSKPSQTERG